MGTVWGGAILHFFTNLFFSRLDFFVNIYKRFSGAGLRYMQCTSKNIIAKNIIAKNIIAKNIIAKNVWILGQNVAYLFCLVWLKNRLWVNSRIFVFFKKHNLIIKKLKKLESNGERCIKFLYCIVLCHDRRCAIAKVYNLHIQYCSMYL